jgi:UDP-2,3-diacylglucosamine hydrolase
LDGPARSAEAVYILGDLFEHWIGDDEEDPHRLSVLEAMRRATRSGVELYVMAGNRDFLYTERFEAETGATLLSDPTAVTRYGQTLLCTHGDALCTDDVPYQRLRAMVRDPVWQKHFLALPRASRELLAQAARSGSRSHTATQSRMLMDVNAATVNAVMTASGIDILLHGHTHRPGRHTMDVGGRPCTRIVLGDWSGTPIIGRWNRDGVELLPLDTLG